MQATLVGGELEFLHHVLHQLCDGEGFALRLELVRFELGQLEQVANQSAQALTVLGSDLEIAALFLWR